LIDAPLFWRKLKSLGFCLFSGVPDSTFGLSYNALADDPDVKFVPAVREDVALGIASAAGLCNQRGAVVMQNSGIGNVVNALTSFNLIYRIPALLVVGWRGYQGTDQDAPEHSVMGEKSQALLELLGVPNFTLDETGWERQVDDLIARMEAQQTPVALLVPPGSLRA
jgi:sulfopyruvate decarboxylase TPP-binding subunit